MEKKIPVGVLGATGMVGQRFIQLIENHPWFEVAWIAASERSADKNYGDAAKWRMKTPLPKRIADMKLSPAVAKNMPKVIFAALDADVARDMEPQFAEAGCAVITNSSAFRMHSNVPLVIPEVNADHLKLIETQTWRKRSCGFIVTNSNCSAMGLVLALAPLHRKFCIEKMYVVTMQAVSGAGYPGVASLDIIGNVIPYIGKEEEKMEAETKKMLGVLNGHAVKDAEIAMSAQCNRVAVEDGHTESVSVQFKKKASAEEILELWKNFRGAPQELKLPHAPDEPVYYDPRPDRPQPRFDVDRGGGMTTTTGRLRRCALLDWKFTVLSHNTIRGAAGAALLNAEILKVQGYLQ